METSTKPSSEVSFNHLTLVHSIHIFIVVTSRLEENNAALDLSVLTGNKDDRRHKKENGYRSKIQMSWISDNLN